MSDSAQLYEWSAICIVGLKHVFMGRTNQLVFVSKKKLRLDATEPFQVRVYVGV